MHVRRWEVGIVCVLLSRKGRDNGWPCVSSFLCQLMFSSSSPDLRLPCLNVIRITGQGTGSETRLHNVMRIGLQPNLSHSLLFHLLLKCAMHHALPVHDVVAFVAGHPLDRTSLWLVTFH